LVVPFLKALILIPVTLLPIINPLSTAPLFVATVGANRSIAQRLARQVAINGWFVVVTSMLIGTYVLAFFGVSLPVVRLGGGLLVAATAWRMLHRTEDDDVHAAAAEQAATLSDAEIVRRSFFPITFPLTTGPGTIAASIALGAQIPTTPVLYVAGAVVAAAGAALVPGSLPLSGILPRCRPPRRIGTRDDAADGVHPACIGIQIMRSVAELNGVTP
jgi:multiple antibiotic resistance protein